MKQKKSPLLPIFLLLTLIFGWHTHTSTHAWAESGLDGTWQSQSGDRATFHQGQFQYFQAGQIVDRGQYGLQNNVLMTQSTISGASEQYSVTLANRNLTLSNVNGTYFFQRLPIQAHSTSSQSTSFPKKEAIEYAQEKGDGAGQIISHALGANHGKIYRHPIGFQFVYPADWTMREQSEFIELLPPNHSTSPQGKEELYLLFGEPAATAGITHPDDPQIGQYLNNQVMGLSSSLKLSGQPMPVRYSKGTGARYEWSGQLPDGRKLSAQALVALINGYGISLLAYGLQDNLERRSPTLEDMFNSFGFGQGQRDSRLFGQWRLVGNDSYSYEDDSPFESDYSRTRMSSGSETTLFFNSNGTWKWKYHSIMTVTSGEESSAGQELGQVFLSNEKNDEKNGNWNADNGKLFRLWDNGQWEDYRYTITQNGQETILKMAADKIMTIWTKEN